MSLREFDKIFNVETKKGAVEGKLRFAEQGLAWKSQTEEIITVKSEDIKKLHWLRCVRNYELRIQLKDGRLIKFENFTRDDYEEIKEFSKTYFHVPLELLEVSVKGWNWGQTRTDSDHLSFLVGNKTLFELPYSEVSNANAGKNEVTIEFTAPPPKRLTNHLHEDQLVECRLYVPGLAPEDSVDVDAEGDESPHQKTAADYLCDILKSKADLGVEKGDTVVSLKELPFLTPRGRYDVEMFKDSLRLRGKSYDYKITYTQITMLFLLPKDDLHTLFVLGLDPPLRQGQTRYPFLVLQFVRDEEMAVDLNLEASVIADQYSGRLQKSYDAPTFEVVSSIFRGLINKKMITPGPFRSAVSGNAGVKCSLKANEGFLYALDKSFLFIPKPATFMPHVDISFVTFSRVSGGSSRTIDLVFSMKHGSEVPLSNISREEYHGLEEYLKFHKIKVKNELNEESRLPFLSDDDDGTGSIRSHGSNDNEDEDSDDASFVLPDDENGSDSSFGYDSDESMSSSDSEARRPVLKRKGSDAMKVPPKKTKQS